MSGPVASAEVVRRSPEHASELKESLAEVRQRGQAATLLQSAPSQLILIAVSRYRPAFDILACYNEGQRDFGEGYVGELLDKRTHVCRHMCRGKSECESSCELLLSQLPQDIR